MTTPKKLFVALGLSALRIVFVCAPIITSIGSVLVTTTWLLTGYLSARVDGVLQSKIVGLDNIVLQVTVN